MWTHVGLQRQFKAGKHSNVSVVQFSKMQYYLFMALSLFLIFIFIYLHGVLGAVKFLVPNQGSNQGPLTGEPERSQPLALGSPHGFSLALSLSYQITHSIWCKKHHFLWIFISPCVTTVSIESASNHSNGLFFESFLIFY